MWIGESRDCKREIFWLKWPNVPIKCLGVYITDDYDEFIKSNYKQRLKKMEKTAMSCIRFIANQSTWLQKCA